MVTIAKYSTLVEANLIKEILESEGIHQVVVGELETTLSWLSQQADGIAYLTVREEDAEKAIKIAKSVTEIVPVAISEIDEEDADDEETAPRM
jgi:HEPN domain-containing protein